MAVALDASSPIRFQDIQTPPFTKASAAFTAPADSLITFCGGWNDDGSTVITPSVIDSGGLSWTKAVERSQEESTIGAESSIWWALTTTSVSRTVTMGWDNAAGSPPRRISGKVDVWTGIDLVTPVDTVGANNEGGSLTNNITTTSITPTANGILLVNDVDWNAGGLFDASTDLTEDTATWSLEMSIDRGYKACVNGVGVTGNLNAGGGAGSQHKWCQVIIRAAAAAPGPAQIYPFAITQRGG